MHDQADFLSRRAFRCRTEAIPPIRKKTMARIAVEDDGALHGSTPMAREG